MLTFKIVISHIGEELLDMDAAYWGRPCLFSFGKKVRPSPTTLELVRPEHIFGNIRKRMMCMDI